MDLAMRSVESLRAKSEPTTIWVHTPTIIENGRWGFKSVEAWPSSRNRYIVGYDTADDSCTPRIYRTKYVNKNAGGHANPTYEVYVTTVWQDSELTRLERELRTIA